MVDKSLPFFVVASGGIENEWYALRGHAWRLSLGILVRGASRMGPPQLKADVAAGNSTPRRDR